MCICISSQVYGVRVSAVVSVFGCSGLNMQTCLVHNLNSFLTPSAVNLVRSH